MNSHGRGILARLISGVVTLAMVALPQQTVGASGAVRYARTTGLGSGPCTTWATACKLQRAISIAVPGDKVWVMKGTYRPTTTSDRTKSFHLKNGVAIYGGFLGTETLLSQRNWKTNVTILSGDIGVRGTMTDNSYHVVVGSTSISPTNSTAILDGFTIQQGYAEMDWDEWGGGINNEGGSPTFRNLVIRNNRAVSGAHIAGGAGMSNNGSSPRLSNVVFSGNQAIANGVVFAVAGALANTWSSSPVLTNVQFIGNSATQGGAMFNYQLSSPVMSTVQFVGNSATAGGAMYNTDNSSPAMTRIQFVGNSAADGGGMYNIGTMPTLTDGVFRGNNATGLGGGVYASSSSPLFKLTNVTFQANSAQQGGGIYNTNSAPALSNVTFYGNTAAATGGGIYNYLSSTTLTNASFSGNSAGGGNAIQNDSSIPYIYNSIFWGDGATEISNDSFSIATIDHSIVQGDCPTGGACTNLVTTNPYLGALQNNGGFAKTMALGAASSAIDRGDPATCTAKDERGIARPQGAACDMGAYEVKVMKFISQAAYDGWVLESGQGTGVGNAFNSMAGTLRMGDDDRNRQYRPVLSFNTAGIPDAATVVRAEMWVRKVTMVGDTAALSYIRLDQVNPYFGAGPALAPADFQAQEDYYVVDLVPVVDNWYVGYMTAGSSLPNTNKTGTTQFRPRFSVATDGDHVADYLSFYSAETATTSNRPKLIVYYNP